MQFGVKCAPGAPSSTCRAVVSGVIFFSPLRVDIWRGSPTMCPTKCSAVP